jgi:hypothetical protein
MDMNELVTQQRDILLRKIFKSFFTENIGITTAIDQSGMPRATFYSVPESERLALAEEVSKEIKAEQQADRDAQRLGQQEMLTRVRRKFYGAAEEALDNLITIMRTAQSDFVKEKAAVDILNYIERNFDGEKGSLKGDDEKQLPAPTVNILMPIMAMPDPKSLQPVSHFTVTNETGDVQVIEGEFTEKNSSSSAK